ncbi:MAG: hypothetical protein V4636_12560 [Pseudomonadota bacterium]
MTSAEDAPVGFAPYRLDSHLILNALNNLGMELYTQLGREIPAVALLADYIIAEHGLGHQMHMARVRQTVADEWNVCKVMLSLKASLVGVRLDFREIGDLSGISVLDHGLAVLLREVFVAWPKLAAHDVRLTIQALGHQSLRLVAHLKMTPTTGVRQPFLQSLLSSRAELEEGVGKFDVRIDDGYAWDLNIRLLPQD